MMTRVSSLRDSDSLPQEIDEMFTPVERTRVSAIVSADFYDMENLFAQYHRGLVSEDYWPAGRPYDLANRQAELLPV